MPKTMLKTNVRKELPTGLFTRTYRLFSLIAAWLRERALLYNKLVHLWSKALDNDLQVDAVFLDVTKDALRSGTPQDTVPLIAQLWNLNEGRWCPVIKSKKKGFC